MNLKLQRVLVSNNSRLNFSFSKTENIKIRNKYKLSLVIKLIGKRVNYNHLIIRCEIRCEILMEEIDSFIIFTVRICIIVVLKKKII